MIDDKSLQRALHKRGFYKGKIDGDFGPKSKAARDAMFGQERIGYHRWGEKRRMIALCQWAMKEAGIDCGIIDGLIGPATRYGLEKWQDRLRDDEPDLGNASPHDDMHQQAGATRFPKQRDVHSFYGAPGTGHVVITLPYPMRIAWNKGRTIERISINRKCASSAERALQKVLDHYGYERLRQLGLDLYAGCYNNRNMRGGRSKSMHAYACAIDINSERNLLRWGRDRAHMARAECSPFLDAFESEGWVSLGRERNYDWMHVQAARL